MKKTLLLSLGLLAALPAHAQNSQHLVKTVATPASAGLATPAADLPLTLEHAWQLAEQANPTLKSAQANLNAAEGQRNRIWRRTVKPSRKPAGNCAPRSSRSSSAW